MIAASQYHRVNTVKKWQGSEIFTFFSETLFPTSIIVIYITSRYVLSIIHFYFHVSNERPTIERPDVPACGELGQTLLLLLSLLLLFWLRFFVNRSRHPPPKPHRNLNRFAPQLESDHLASVQMPAALDGGHLVLPSAFAPAELSFAPDEPNKPFLHRRSLKRHHHHVLHKACCTRLRYPESEFKEERSGCFRW